MEDPKKRGFDAIPPDRRREISSKGGRQAHARGTAHEFTPEEARVAGAKGGLRAHELGRAHRFIEGSAAAAAAGRKGAAVRKANQVQRERAAAQRAAGKATMAEDPVAG